MIGQLCTVGDLKPLFYYATKPHLYIEHLDRRNRELRHLVVLVDADGNPVELPEGCTFKHVSSMEERNLLDNHVRRVEAESSNIAR